MYTFRGRYGGRERADASSNSKGVSVFLAPSTLETRVRSKLSTPRIDDLYDLYDTFPLHDLDLLGMADLFPILYDLAYVAGWNRHNLHDPAHVSWVGSVVCRSCTTSHNGR